MDGYQREMQHDPTDPVLQELHEEEFQYPLSVKIGVFTISVLALFLVGWQAQARLKLIIPTIGSATTGIREEAISILDAEDQQLREQDSDQDGLTDYQELRVYGSSPFIADSDSDGISDADEIRNQSDPNCPEGTNCQSSIFFEPIDSGSIQFNPEIERIVSSPSEIRRLLKQGGADPSVVDRLDDQSLQALAKESLDLFQERSSQENLDLIQTLDEGALRELLLGLGISQSELDELEEEDLQLLLESIGDDLSLNNEITTEEDLVE